MSRMVKTTLSMCVVASMCIANYTFADTIAMAEQSNEKPIQLETLVVTASGYEQDVTQAPATMTVITAEEINKRQNHDITDVLRNTPGVVITGTGARQTISIRGMSSNYTLVLVDGKRQYSKDINPNGDGAGFEKNILPPMSAIERIEVIRGPASTLYGTDAMGGVINIITKKVGDKWTGTVDAMASLQADKNAGNIYDGSVYVTGPLIQNKLGMKLSFDRHQRNEDAYPTYGGFSESKKESVTGGLTYVLNDQHQFDFDTNFVYQENRSTMGKTVNPTAFRASGNFSRNYRNVYALTHKGNYTSNLSSNTYVQYENSRNPDRGGNVGKGLDLDTVIANSQWNWNIANHELMLGANYKDEHLIDRATNQNSAMPISDLKRWNFAIFAEDHWRIWDKFKLTTGVRYNHDENYGSNVSPRLYGVYTLNDNWTFKGGVATGYKQPDLKQSTPTVQSIGGGGGGVTVGNADLKPETSMSYELATAWTGEQSKATLSAYYTQFKDYITTYQYCISGGANIVRDPSKHICRDPFGRTDVGLGKNGYWFSWGTYINIGRADLYGAELSYETMLADVVKLQANYTFMNSEIKVGTDKGKPLNQMPKHTFNITADYAVNDKLNIWNRLHYRSETTESLGTIPTKNPGYAFYDVGLNYQFTPNITGKLAVYNLADKIAEDSTGNRLLDGRRYAIGLNMQF